jgi:uncharacterized phiE125 gp8 family phage protein
MFAIAAEHDSETFRGASREMPPVVTTAPTVEPLDEAEAKLHCRIDNAVEGSLILRLIKMAREAVEFDAEIALCTQTRKQYLDYFPAGPIELRSPPVQTVASITYVDPNGTTQTLSASLYETDTTARPGLVVPTYGNSWPSTRVQLRAVTVTFTCGYGGAEAVPEIAKQAMALRIAAAYQNREMGKEETAAYDNLISRLKWRAFL